MMSFLSKLTSMFGGGRKDSAERANVEELKQKIGEAAAGGAVSPAPMQPSANPGAPEAPASFGPSPVPSPTQQPTAQSAPGMSAPAPAPAPTPAPFPNTQPAQPAPMPTPPAVPTQPPVQPGQPNGPQQ